MTSPRMIVSVDSRLESVPLVEHLVRTFCESAGATVAESRQIEVCVAEAMNNCVIHSYKLCPGNTVELRVCKTGSSLVLEIFDHGFQMDPKELLRSEAHLLDCGARALHELPEGGRGLCIIQSFMDTVQYTSLKKTNCLRMTRRVSGPVEDKK